MKRNFGFSIRCLIILLVLFVQVSIFAETKPVLKSIAKTTFQLGSLFKDHMVLQRDMPIPVWGKAAAGSTITVHFANYKKQTIADSNGKWSVKLSALKGSFEPKTMIISSSMDEKAIKISDVLVGEVWICSGQSNMQFSVNGAPEVKKLIP